MPRSSRPCLALFAACALALPAAAQELVVNGDFDTNIDGWSLGSFEFIEIEWSASDVDGDPGSGSLEMLAAASGFAVQCVPVEEGASYRLAGAIAPLAPEGESLVEFSLGLFFRGEAACAGPPLGGDALVAPGETGVWHRLADVFEAPTGAQSAEVRLRATWFAGQQRARFDAISVPEPGAGAAGAAALLALAGARRGRLLAGE
jgi:hypothetical protein